MIVATCACSSSVFAQDAGKPPVKPEAKTPPAAAEEAPKTAAEKAPPAKAAAAEAPAAAEVPPESYEHLKVDDNLRQSGIVVGQIIGKDSFGSGEEDLLAKYFKDYELPRWTNPENYPNLYRSRQALRSQLGKTKGGPVFAKLNALLLEEMPKMAKANYHPAVRVNAMLVVGDLNVRPPPPREDAKPLPDALPILVANFQDENQIDGVRLAALLGIVRHAKLGIADEEARRQVAAAMLKLATAQDPGDRTPEGHAWARRRAIEVLGVLKSPGEQGSVAQALVAILSEPDAPFSVRCAAARAIGDLGLTPQSGLDAAAVTRALGRLALDACKDEIAKCKKDDKRLVSPRLLKARLVSVRIGLTGEKDAVEQPTKGIAALATKPEDKSFLENVRKPIDRWLEQLDNKDLIPVEVNPEDLDPMRGGMGGMGGMEGLLGGAGPGRAGARGMAPGMAPGMGFGAVEDPAKKASDKFIEELSKELEEFQTLIETVAAGSTPK